MDLTIFEKNPGFVYHLYILHSLAPLNILEDFFGHCGTLPRLREPSWTFIDPPMDPKIYPVRLILGDLWYKKALQGPFMAQNYIFFLDRSLDNVQT